MGILEGFLDLVTGFNRAMGSTAEGALQLITKSMKRRGVSQLDDALNVHMKQQDADYQESVERSPYLTRIGYGAGFLGEALALPSGKAKLAVKAGQAVPSATKAGLQLVGKRAATGAASAGGLAAIQPGTFEERLQSGAVGAALGATGPLVAGTARIASKTAAKGVELTNQAKNAILGALPEKASKVVNATSSVIHPINVVKDKVIDVGLKATDKISKVGISPKSTELAKNIATTASPAIANITTEAPDTNPVNFVDPDEAPKLTETTAFIDPDTVSEQPAVPQPSVPQPAVPQPAVPQPAVPQPAVPQPAVPQPSVPQPAVPQPAIPQQVASQNDAIDKFIDPDEASTKWTSEGDIKKQRAKSSLNTFNTPLPKEPKAKPELTSRQKEMQRRQDIEWNRKQERWRRQDEKYAQQQIDKANRPDPREKEYRKARDAYYKKGAGFIRGLFGVKPPSRADFGLEPRMSASGQTSPRSNTLLRGQVNEASQASYDQNDPTMTTAGLPKYRGILGGSIGNVRPGEVRQLPQQAAQTAESPAIMKQDNVRETKPEVNKSMPIHPRTESHRPLVEAAISKSKYLNADELLQIANVESRGNPNAVSPTGAKGLFQFIRSTWNAVGGKGSRFDPKASVEAAIELANRNGRYLEQRLGRKPEAYEIYIAHNIGAAGASKLLNADPKTVVSKALIGSKPEYNPLFFKKGRNNVTVEEALKRYKKHLYV